MKNSFGSHISMTLFGESHGPEIGIVLDGLPSGFAIDEAGLLADLEKRKASGRMSTQRHEEDVPIFISGLFNGYTTGTPLTILFKNRDTRSGDYTKIEGRLRPGHADFTAYEKYNGFQDYRGGGHFSGRLTAPLVAAGNICRQILEQKSVKIGSHIEQLYNIKDENFSEDITLLEKEIDAMNQESFAVLDADVKEDMKEAILQAADEGDSVGGIIESAVIGLPAGIGEPFFDSVESVVSHLLFSIPAVKGVSFGKGFGFANLKGSQANDALYYDTKIKTRTNHNAGINGGITNGMPIVVHTVIKPTPSIYKVQESVDYNTLESVDLQIQGRHDPCILHRARIVVDSVIAFGILDLWMAKEAVSSFEETYER